MNRSLLATKLYIPLPRPNLVSRPRLMDQLTEGISYPLTLLSAPAGYGKTTLLSQWIAVAHCADRVAWVSLDEKDNDPTRFWAYVTAAFDIGELWPSQEPLGLAHDAAPDLRAVIDSALTALVNALAAEAEERILILDDYHVIEAPLIQSTFQFLLEHLPPHVHVVISTRTDPALPLVRQRARRQLLELRASDLRFTPNEAAAFLNRVMGLQLSAEDISALETRTEGWIAGLQLAALSMQGRDDLSGFIAAFTGSNRYVLDYLIEEVLQRLPANVQDLMLQTSILDRVCGPLADAIMADPAAASSQAALEMLERANLFIIPLDEERRWYRYHRLFADFLLNRLRQVYPDRVPDLHRRAAEWHEQNGLISDAIDHALAAQDYARAGRLIEQTAEGILMRSHADTLLQWLDTLPDALVHSRPRLCVYHALAMIMLGRLDAVESHLQDAEKNMPGHAVPDQDEDVRGMIDGIRAITATYDGDVQRARELAREALDHLSTRNSFLRTMADWIVGLICCLDGDMAASQHALATSLEDSQASGNSLVALMSVHTLGYLQSLQGRLRQAAETYGRWLEFVERVGTRDKPFPTAGVVYAGLGEILREQNDLETAERYLADALKLGRQWKGAEWALEGFLSMARLKLEQGQIEQAQRLVMEIEQLAGHDILIWHKILTETLQVQIWIAQRNLAPAAEWADRQAGPHLDGQLRMVHMLAFPTLARVRIAQGQFKQAIELLTPLHQQAETKGWMGVVLQTLVLSALAERAQGNGEQAIALVRQALVLAEPEGYVRLFVDEGEPMRSLFLECEPGIARDDPHRHAFLRKVLAAFPQTVVARRNALPGRENLTERERQVLELIATGLSNREIADRLVVTPGTVKRHAYNLFSKLGVTNRTRAVVRARELELL